jgi:hypothetical protein
VVESLRTVVDVGRLFQLLDINIRSCTLDDRLRTYFGQVELGLVSRELSFNLLGIPQSSMNPERRALSCLLPFCDGLLHTGPLLDFEVFMTSIEFLQSVYPAR